MNLKNLFLFSSLLVLASCSSGKIAKISATDRTTPSDKVDVTTFRSKYLFTDSSKIAHFESEKFVSNALNNYTISKVRKASVSFLKSSTEIVINKHDSSLKDTVYTYSDAGNKIQIYRAKQNDFIFTYDVTSSKLSLIGNVKPGMSKKNFIKKFQIMEPLPDVVQMTNSEGTMKFKFFFENNKLKRIISYLYLD